MGFKDNRDNRDIFFKLQNFLLLKEWAAEQAPDKLKNMLLTKLKKLLNMLKKLLNKLLNKPKI